MLMRSRMFWPRLQRIAPERREGLAVESGKCQPKKELFREQHFVVDLYFALADIIEFAFHEAAFEG